MKEIYQKPTVEVIKLSTNRTVLQATSPDPVPGGSGDPDASELYDMILLNDD